MSCYQTNGPITRGGGGGGGLINGRLITGILPKAVKAVFENPPVMRIPMPLKKAMSRRNIKLSLILFPFYIAKRIITVVNQI